MIRRRPVPSDANFAILNLTKSTLFWNEICKSSIDSDVFDILASRFFFNHTERSHVREDGTEDQSRDELGQRQHEIEEVQEEAELC